MVLLLGCYEFAETAVAVLTAAESFFPFFYGWSAFEDGDQLKGDVGVFLRKYFSRSVHMI